MLEDRRFVPVDWPRRGSVNARLAAVGAELTQHAGKLVTQRSQAQVGIPQTQIKRVRHLSHLRRAGWRVDAGIVGEEAPAHPSRKNKDAARVGHPGQWVGRPGRGWGAQGGGGAQGGQEVTISLKSAMPENPRSTSPITPKCAARTAGSGSRTITLSKNVSTAGRSAAIKASASPYARA